MTNYCTRQVRRALLLCFLLLAGIPLYAETNPRFYAVEVSASVQAAPAQITLQWAADPYATGYTIFRKAPATASWTQLTSLAGSINTWSDANVADGGSYEYAITKTTSLGYKGTGYVLAGINAPMTENRGKLVLVVDNTHAAALTNELARLQQDLVGDGWTVIRHDVSRTATPPQIKNLIKNAYILDPANVKSVFLFGHVAVPYSGNYNPDGHPDHQGAWTADTYYGDMDGTWTDSNVNNSGAEKAWNRNVPGDGKFDQSDLPSDIDLAVGRVDLFNMTCFSNKAWSRSELDLLRAYLDKDHNFRHGRIVVPRRGLVCDNFGETEGEAFASTGWRNFAPFFGAQNNVQVPYGQYFSTLRDNGYLWSYGTGGGSWYTCNGVGSSDDFANTEIKTVFTAFLGSYFGDWDNESAFLRAPLGSGYALATAWAGRPHWFFHPMGLGETIGTATKLSQNNRYGGLYGGQNWGTRQVHVSLLGDPTLRMHPVIPPSNIAVNGGTITWTQSTDSEIQGYTVYRATSLNAPFTKITGPTPVSNLFFVDPAAVSGSVYMVRAVKLEQSGSGTYLNLSQGSFSSGSIIPEPTPTPTPDPSPSAPPAPSNLSGTALSTNQIRLQWTDNSADETGFRIVRRIGTTGAYATIAVSANSTSYTDGNLTPGTPHFYKIHSYNSVGSSSDSAEISVTTQAVPAPPPSANNTAQFVKTDFTTSGSWKGTYGTQGSYAPYALFNTPGYVQFSAYNNYPAIWANPSTDPRALQSNSGTSRFATRWQADSMFFYLQFTDTGTHKVSFYFVDFDNAGRQQKLEIFDNVSGALLASTIINNFQSGVYSTWNLKGKIRVKITRLAGPAAVMSGVFFDSPTVATLAPANSIRFLGPNTSTGGTWKNVLGTQGYQIAAEGAQSPSYANVTFSGKTDHIWNWSTTDTAALQKSSGPDRLASCWYSADSFDVRVNLTDGLTHKISFYALDWDNSNRSQRVDVLDASTGAVLHTTNLTSFQRGAYLNYDIKGSVTFRFTRTAGPNAVISGLFFDDPSAAL